MNPRDIKIRLATNEDGQRIGGLLKASGFHFDDFQINWSDIYPYWLVAEVAGEVIGCVQACPSKPIGQIGLLSVDETVGIKARAIAYKTLVMGAAATLYMAGCQLASGVISDDEESWFGIAQKRGWTFIDSGNIVMKRLHQ